MRILEANLLRELARAASDVQDAAKGREVKARGDLLANRDAVGVHDAAESPQANRVLVKRRERLLGGGPEGLLPPRTILPECIGQILPHAVEGVRPHGKRFE